MKDAEFFRGVYMEPVGYMDCDRCQLCGEDLAPDDAKKAEHLKVHEARGDIERAGPKVGWRLCFGRSLKPVPEGIPEAEFQAGMEKARRIVEEHNAALHALAEVFDGPLIGDVRCACGQRIVLGETYKRRAFRLRATGELACDGCAYRAAWKAVIA